MRVLYLQNAKKAMQALDLPYLIIHSPTAKTNIPAS